MKSRATGLQAALRDIRDGLRSRAGRTALSFSAMAIGFAALTALLAVLGGLEDRSDRLVRELGINVAGILGPQRPEMKDGPELEERHRTVLARNFPDCLVSGIRRFDIPMTGKDESLTVIATDGDLARVRRWRMLDGRFLDARDVEEHRRVAVVSQTLSGRWSWKTGDLIELRGYLFRVVGVIEAEGGGPGAETKASAWMFGDLVVFVPRTLGRLWLTQWDGPRPPLDAIFMSVPESRDFKRTVEAGRRLLAQPEMRAGRLSWVLPEALRAGVRELQRTIAWTGGSVAALCLILGGMTLMSLMIANVRDRAAEIGLRRALGAEPRDIGFLFFLEGELTAGSAAVAASLLVHLFVLLGGAPASLPLKLGLTTALIPPGAAVVLAAAFSYGPARAAARVTPSEALRYE